MCDKIRSVSELQNGGKKMGISLDLISGEFPLMPGQRDQGRCPLRTARGQRGRRMLRRQRGARVGADPQVMLPLLCGEHRGAAGCAPRVQSWHPSRSVLFEWLIGLSHK